MRLPPHHDPSTASSGFTAPSPAIATAINTATRPQHTELNRLIIARLPLALPPHSSTPLPYAVGVSAFAQIYSTFESAWLSITALKQSQDGGLSEDLRVALDRLLDPRIRRSAVFDQDSAYLWHRVHELHGEESADAVDSWRRSEMLQDYLRHISASIAARPHVIVAYAWVMYMALFSGGRWIRMVLNDAGAEFWTGRAKEEKENNVGGFTFLTFSGVHDGEDIKAAFKSQLAAVETLLSARQKDEIVEEARYIFQKSIELVYELDELVMAAMSMIEVPANPSPAPTVTETETEEKPETDTLVRQLMKMGKLNRRAMSAQFTQLLVAIVMCVGLVAVLHSLRRSNLLQSQIMGLGGSVSRHNFQVG